MAPPAQPHLHRAAGRLSAARPNQTLPPPHLPGPPPLQPPINPPFVAGQKIARIAATNLSHLRLDTAKLSSNQHIEDDQVNQILGEVLGASLPLDPLTGRSI